MQDGKLHMLKEIDDVRHHHWVLCEHQKMTELAVEETNQALSCVGWDHFQLPHKKTKPYPWLQLSQGRLEEEMSTLSKARVARIRSLTDRGTPGSKAFFCDHFLRYWGAQSLMSWGKMMFATQTRSRISITIHLKGWWELMHVPSFSSELLILILASCCLGLLANHKLHN